MIVYILPRSSIYHTSIECARLTRSNKAPLSVQHSPELKAAACTWCRRRESRGVPGVIALALTKLSRYRHGDIVKVGEAYEIRVTGQPTLVITRLGHMVLRHD